MEFIECAEYRKACEKASGANLPWEKLKGASVMISGATGMIGSFLTDLIMYQNRNRNLGCRVIALGRNEEKAKKRFAAYWQNPIFEFRCCDINRPMNLPEEQVDYILHLASNTHPVAYATDPDRYYYGQYNRNLSAAGICSEMPDTQISVCIICGDLWRKPWRCGEIYRKLSGIY